MTLTDQLAAMDGTAVMDLTAGGVTFKVHYDQEQARGDNGQPVRGDITGEYELVRYGADDGEYGKVVFRQHVSPHGTSGHGNPHAKRWAAERVSEAITRTAR